MESRIRAGWLELVTWRQRIVILCFRKSLVWAYAFIFVNMCNTHLDIRIYSYLLHPTFNMHSSFFSFLFLKNILLFLKRGGEGEKHHCVSPPLGIWPAIQACALWFSGWHSNHWASPARASVRSSFNHTNTSFLSECLKYHQNCGTGY